MHYILVGAMHRRQPHISTSLLSQLGHGTWILVGVGGPIFQEFRVSLVPRWAAHY